MRFQGKSLRSLPMKKENHYWGSEKAFDLVMEVMDSGRATSVESSKQELEGALGFRADILDRESRTNGGGRKDI